MNVQKSGKQSVHAALNSAEIQVGDGPEHEVRFSSGGVTYVEALRGGRWMGRGWFAGELVDESRLWESDAFEIRMKDQPIASIVRGTLLSPGWHWVSAGELPQTETGGRHFCVELASAILPVLVRVHTVLDGTPVLMRWLEITNTAAIPLAITSLFPWSGCLWGADATFNLCHSLKWHVPWEGWVGWTPIYQGPNLYRQDQGLVWDDPFFILRNESNGEYFFGELSWPVNYEMDFYNDRDLTFKIGPSADNPLRIVAPGETVTSPSVHLGYTRGDFDASVQAMHTHVRRSVLPELDADKACRVQYLLPEDQGLTVYRGENFNEENLKKLMDVAAAAGVELFIVDGPTWAEGYGNWVPKKSWFPNGFDPLRDYAHQKGLLFGVYAEVEGGRGHWEETRAWAEHPEWFGYRNPDYAWRNFINLAIPEAAAYAEAELRQIIEGLKVDIYRHDQNGCFGGEGSETQRDGFVENDYWRYYDKWHGLLKRMREDYPDLILHQASGGGSRLELATLSCWHEHYTSDRVTYPHVYRMTSGVSAYLPPEALVTPIGMAGNGRDQPELVTMLRSVYALGNTPMIFNALLPKSMEEFTPELRQLFQHYASLYQTFIRPMLRTSKIYHHAPLNATGGVESGDWFAMEFAAPDQSKGWGFIVHLSKNLPAEYLFKPRGLSAGRNYAVTFDSTGKTEVIKGSELMEKGLLIQIKTEPLSELVLFEAR